MPLQEHVPGGGLDSGDTAGGRYFLGGPFRGTHCENLEPGVKGQNANSRTGTGRGYPAIPPKSPPPGAWRGQFRHPADSWRGHHATPVPWTPPPPGAGHRGPEPPRMVSTSKIGAAGAPTPRMGRSWLAFARSSQSEIAHSQDPPRRATQGQQNPHETPHFLGQIRLFSERDPALVRDTGPRPPPEKSPSGRGSCPWRV